MDPVFSDFLRSLGSTGDDELFQEVWDRLRHLLSVEIKKRGLWLSPPSYLGIYGWPRWESSGDGALEELVADCYAFIFVDRQKSLRAQLSLKPDIEGLVLLNVRHFLLERQREHDPLGSRVFEIVRAAARSAVAGGDLYVLSGDPRVRNETVLGQAGPAEEPAPVAHLRERVERWNDELLPDLLTAEGRRYPPVVARLRGLLCELAEQVHAFRFRDLVDPLKHDTRRRWAHLLADGDGLAPPLHASPSDPAPTIRAGRTEPAAATLFESRQSLLHLVESVSEAIQGTRADPRTRQYLTDLWSFLQAQAGVREEAMQLLAREGNDEEGDLSHRELSRRLGIPRERFPDLFATLRQLVRQTREPAKGREPRRAEERIRPAGDRPQLGGSS